MTLWTGGRRPSTPPTRPPARWSAASRCTTRTRCGPRWSGPGRRRSWWAGLGFDGRAERLRAWRVLLAGRVAELAELVHRENGKPVADAVLEIAARHRPPRLGRRRNARAGARPAPGACPACCWPTTRPPGVPAVRRRRRDRPVELPGVHADGLDRVRAGGRQRGRLQAVSEYTPAVGAVAGRHVRRGGAASSRCCRSSPACGDDRRRAVPAPASTRSPSPARPRPRKKVMAACAETLTPVLLECGGKDAHDRRRRRRRRRRGGRRGVWGGMTNAGQTCIGIERVYAVDAGLRRVRGRGWSAKARALRPGDDRRGRRTGRSTMPAQIDVDPPAHRRTPWPAAAGRWSAAPTRSGPPYVHPVVLVDVPEDSAAVREETFGPTLTVTRVRDADEAVELANATPYGLGGAVFGRGAGDGARPPDARPGWPRSTRCSPSPGSPRCRSAASATPASAGSTARTGCASSPGPRRSPASASPLPST